MSRAPVTIKFDADEAELVAEALDCYRPDAAADRLKAVRMRDLIDGELGKGRRR